MPRQLNRYKQAAARARTGRARARTDTTITLGPPSEDEECSWDRTVNYYHTDTDWSTDQESTLSSESESEGFSELEGDGLIASLENATKWDSRNEVNAFDRMALNLTSAEWAKAEHNRHLGYDKNSDRTKRWHAQAAHAKEAEDSVIRKRYVPSLLQIE